MDPHAVPPDGLSDAETDNEGASGLGPDADDGTVSSQRLCNLCHVMKPNSCFYSYKPKERPTRRFSDGCMECIRNDNKRWYEENKDTGTRECSKCKTTLMVRDFYIQNGVKWRQRVTASCKKCTWKRAVESGSAARKVQRRRATQNPVPTVAQKRCSKCQETKAASEFHRDKYMADGLYIYCKTCTKQRKQQRKEDKAQLRSAEGELASEEAKACKHCQQTLPMSSFYRNKDCKDGRAKVCKDCYKKTHRYHVTEPTVVERECKGCHTVKLAAHFYRNPSRCDGLARLCKDCTRAQKRAGKPAAAGDEMDEDDEVGGGGGDDAAAAAAGAGVAGDAGVVGDGARVVLLAPAAVGQAAAQQAQHGAGQPISLLAQMEAAAGGAGDPAAAQAAAAAAAAAAAGLPASVGMVTVPHGQMAIALPAGLASVPAVALPIGVAAGGHHHGGHHHLAVVGAGPHSALALHGMPTAVVGGVDGVVAAQHAAAAHAAAQQAGVLHAVPQLVVGGLEGVAVSAPPGAGAAPAGALDAGGAAGALHASQGMHVPAVPLDAQGGGGGAPGALALQQPVGGGEDAGGAGGADGSGVQGGLVAGLDPAAHLHHHHHHHHTHHHAPGAHELTAGGVVVASDIDAQHAAAAASVLAPGEPPLHGAGDAAASVLAPGDPQMGVVVPGSEYVHQGAYGGLHDHPQ